jgi:hypothetical protein
MSLERRTPEETDSFDAGDLVGMARLVAVSGFRVGAWATVTGLNAGRRLVDVALHPDHAWELAEDVRYAAGAVTRAMVGDRLDDVRAAAATNPVVRVVADTIETVTPGQVHPREQAEPENPLHAAGRDLLHRSRDVWAEDPLHPAYARIIEELAPDEGRILLLLLRKGPQASVDVRTGGLVGTVSSTLVAPQLNMIGALAGCRYVDRVPSYLHNLERLGLIWFSAEQVSDPMEYQVLEAQPDVVEAMASVKRAKCVRRSLHLTPFGEDFCRDGLGLHLSTEELAEVPRHGNPAQDT